MGKLLVIEGVDSSGKATQAKKLLENLKGIGYDVQSVEFPDYKSNSSALVKMYLGGEFGKNAEDVNPYSASAFFAVDRVASYLTNWKKSLDDGKIVLADRYTTSNFIHQAAKISDKAEKDKFLDWVSDFEYNKLGLPKPDLTIFLDMPVPYAKMLMANRPNKINNSQTLDIHESDTEYLNHSYQNAHYVADKFGWHKILCVKDEKVRSIDDIAGEILGTVKEVL